jgi:hypothetical protein
MLINYWDCQYSDYEEWYDREEEIRLYGCSHPDKENYSCNGLDNKYTNLKAECPLAKLEPSEEK